MPECFSATKKCVVFLTCKNVQNRRVWVKEKKGIEYKMMFNIMVGVLGLLAVVAGIFAWKLENGSFGEEDETEGNLEVIVDQRKEESK